MMIPRGGDWGSKLSLLEGKAVLRMADIVRELSNDKIYSCSNQTLKKEAVKLAISVYLLYQNAPL